MVSLTPSAFESFNARTLTADQVAKTFVPSPHFAELCRRRHSIVLGPRGSGKNDPDENVTAGCLERLAT